MTSTKRATRVRLPMTFDEAVSDFLKVKPPKAKPEATRHPKPKKALKHE